MFLGTLGFCVYGAFVFTILCIERKMRSPDAIYHATVMDEY